MSVLRAGALSMLALAAAGLTRLIHGSLVSHATDKASYGVVGSLLAITVIASLLLPGGVASATSKYIALLRGAGEPAQARAAHRFLTRLSLAGAALLGLAAAAAAGALFDLSGSDVAAVGLLTAAYSLYTVDKAAMYGFGRVGAYTRLELCTSTLAVGVTVLVVAAGWRAYLLPLAVGYAVFVLGARLLLRRDLHGDLPDRAMPGADVPARGQPDRVRPDPASPDAPGLDRREVVGFVGIASIGTLASAGFLQGTQVLAAWLVPLDEVAHMAAAVTLVAPMWFLPRALGIALFPAMAHAHGAGDSAEVRRHADVFTRALAALLAPVFAAVILLAPVVLTLFGGPGYAEGATVLRLMLVAAFLNIVAVPSVNTLSSGRGWRVRVPMLSGVAGCLTGLAVIFVLGRAWGTMGVATGYLVGAAITAGVPVAVAWRGHVMQWAGPLSRALMVVGGAGAVAWLVGSARTGMSLPAAVALALAAALVGATIGIVDLRMLARGVRRPARTASPSPSLSESI